MKAEASPNIAFIKYWGKLPFTRDEDRNLGTNPSLSLTLSQAKTETQVVRSHGPRTEFILNGSPASDADTAKVIAHLERVASTLGKELGTFRVESRNNFPAGAGIASSASAFAALTLAALGEMLGLQGALEYCWQNPQMVGALARRGSGSACRSLAGPFTEWNGTFARRLDCVWPLRDTILMISKKHKAVPSSDGHKLAQSSPLFLPRLARVPGRLAEVHKALTDKNLSALGPLLETEANELHEIARTGTPGVDYALPETRLVLNELARMPQRDFYFTLDAGPNVHLISERPIREDAERMLRKLGLDVEIWEDHAGVGPTLEGHPISC
ncbi:MAG: hypothetical protein JST16_13730 [Bdellovibrionales bacterium]|nr:hypothetical protein [Bdellovibrionales bacterium]